MALALLALALSGLVAGEKVAMLSGHMRNEGPKTGNWLTLALCIAVMAVGGLTLAGVPSAIPA